VGLWPLRDRSFPSTVSDPALADFYWVPLVFHSEDTGWRVFSFVLRRQARIEYIGDNADDANPNDPDSVPKVRRITGVTSPSPPQLGENRLNFTNGPENNLQVKIGDGFLTSTGVIYRAVEADEDGVEVDGFIDQANVPDAIWYAPPGTGRISPTKRILAPAAVKELE
jgi:hypothetical protein